jgi:hypothetical protein
LGFLGASLAWIAGGLAVLGAATCILGSWFVAMILATGALGIWIGIPVGLLVPVVFLAMADGFVMSRPTQFRLKLGARNKNDL